MSSRYRFPSGKKRHTCLLLEGLANTFLYDDNKGSSPSAIVPILEDPLHKSTVERKEADGCALLSQGAPIAEQERDPEIICLGHQDLDEKEADVVPCCYFKKRRNTDEEMVTS